MEVKLMAENLVVQSKVKDLIKNMNMRASGDFADGMSTQVEKMVKAACKRAKDNGRQTVRAYDI